MSRNLELANEWIAKCNLKFCDGTGNLKNSFLDRGLMDRNRKLTKEIRKELHDNVRYVAQINVFNPEGEKIDSVYTLETRGYDTGRVLDESAATIGNCGERSYWVAYKLRKSGVPNVCVLSGDGGTSINHDFLVIGATNVENYADYSEDVAPDWDGEDIVICDPWYQAGRKFHYQFGVAYPLARWSYFIPKIVASTLKGRRHALRVNRKQFSLQRM